MKNDKKYKFPIKINNDIDLPDLEFSDKIFDNIIIKKKIDSKIKKVEKIKNKRCQSNKLI